MKKLKITKKLFALMLSIVMMLALGVTANAATITINNAVNNQTYTAYKVFDVTYSTTTDDESGEEEGEESATPTNYAYTTTNSTLVSAVQSAVQSGNLSGITFTATTTSGTYNVTIDEDSFSAADFAAWISENLNSLNLGIGTTGTVSNDTATINVTDAGYYFVTSSVGTLCFLQTAADTIEIDEKNEEPEVEKEANKSTVTIGDTVTFTITITAQPGAENYVLHDTMTDGLTFGSIFSVVAGSTTLTENTDYTVSTTNTDNCTFEISFAQGYLDTITEETEIVVTYTATVNASAIRVDAANSAHLEYGDHVTTTTETVSLPTYSFDLVKTDTSDNLLNGAEFKLYTTQTGGSAIYFVQTDSGYRVATSSEEDGATDTIVVSNGSVTIDGLANGTYYLEETEAPDGYNMLTSRVSVTINGADNSATIESGKYLEGGVEVENKAGSLLPSTGGMGTTILYIAGIALVAGVGIVLVARRRMNAE